MTVVTLDEVDEEQFRRSIESSLRRGLADSAIERLRGLLAPYAGPGRMLPERFLTVTADEFHLLGWEGLADAIRAHDRPGRPISALTIAFGWPGEDAPGPDDNGNLAPHIEVGYYNDESFPFSKSSREDLLDGYSYHGCTWSGDAVATDAALTLAGIDDLHGALALLEAKLLETDEPDEEGIRAGSLGASLLSALLFKAVGQRIASDGLPRPLCVMSGSSGVYPYFDAPVVGLSEAAIDAAEAAEVAEAEAPADTGVPRPRYSSLLMTSIPRARKRAVLVMDNGEDPAGPRLASLRDLPEGEAAPAGMASGYAPETPFPDPVITPAPDGPLLAKKQPKHEWDFRDMLTPGAPEAEADEEPQGLPRDVAPEAAPEFSPHGPVNDLPEEPAAADVPHQPEPVPEPAPAPAPSYLPQVEAQPGFSLYQEDPQERLQLLVAKHMAQPAPAFRPVEAADMPDAAPIASPAAAEPAPPPYANEAPPSYLAVPDAPVAMPAPQPAATPAAEDDYVPGSGMETTLDRLWSRLRGLVRRR